MTTTANDTATTNDDMKVGPVWVLHHLGCNYSAPDEERDLERFDTLGDALHAAAERGASGHWRSQDFAYVNRAPESVLTPSVYDDALRVFLADPTGEIDVVADALWERDGDGDMFRVH